MRRAPQPCSARAKSTAGARRRTPPDAPDAGVPPSPLSRPVSSCIPSAANCLVETTPCCRVASSASAPCPTLVLLSPTGLLRAEGWGVSPPPRVQVLGRGLPKRGVTAVYASSPHGHRRRETQSSARAAAAGTVGDPRRRPAARALRGGGRCLRAAEQGNARPRAPNPTRCRSTRPTSTSPTRRPTPSSCPPRTRSRASTCRSSSATTKNRARRRGAPSTRSTRPSRASTSTPAPPSSAARAAP